MVEMEWVPGHGFGERSGLVENSTRQQKHGHTHTHTHPFTPWSGFQNDQKNSPPWVPLLSLRCHSNQFHPSKLRLTLEKKIGFVVPASPHHLGTQLH